METQTETRSESPQFNTDNSIPDGFVVSIVTIIFIFAVVLIVVIKPLRAYVVQYFGFKSRESDGGASIEKYRLSPRTVLYKVNLNEDEIFVVESALNVSISVSDKIRKSGNSDFQKIIGDLDS